MRRRLIEKLRCPNTHGNALECYAVTAQGNGHTTDGVYANQLGPDDDIVRGILFERAGKAAYPIWDHVGLLLSDEDTDVPHHTKLLQALRPDLPAELHDIIESTVARLRQRADTKDGTWNREEMAYYDRQSADEETRRRAVDVIHRRPDWNVYIPREKTLLRHLEPGSTVLEVGCASARTMTWASTLGGYDFEFTGIDISWNKLLMAKAASPNGDFFQASALNLPFKDACFDAILAFGSLHHLPDPLKGVREAVRCSRQYFGLHEPIDTPKLFEDGTAAKNLIHRVFENYEHSDHDNEINVDHVVAELRKADWQTVDSREAVTVVKPLIKPLCDLIGNNRSRKLAYRGLFLIDDLVVQTLCRLSRRFGPRAITLLAKKAAASPTDQDQGNLVSAATP